MLAIFDLNDTLIASRRADGWVLHAADWLFIPGALDALRAARGAGWSLAVATNQPGAGRFPQECPEPRLRAVLAQIQRELVRATGAPLPFYLCLHDKGDGCECRKPRPGLIRQAVADAGLKPRAGRYPAVTIGDRDSDAQAGAAAGCSSIIVAPAGHDPAFQADVAAPTIADVPAALEAIARRFA